MSNLNEEDIAEIMEGGNMAVTTKEIFDVKYREIDDDLIEWNELIGELSSKEKALLEWKELHQVHSDKIIAETDFKSLYGKNNDKVRKEHVKKELSTWYDTITDLELGISWINRRIVFLKELIRVKRVMMEVKE